MGLCGYNKQMLDAEREFGDGLWKQLLKRSLEEGRDIPETLQLEIDEMEVFETALRKYDDQIGIEDVLGIVYFARSLYRQCLIAGGTEEAYFKLLKKSVDRQFKMDGYYYSTLRPRFGAVKGLEELAQWLNSNPLQ